MILSDAIDLWRNSRKARGIKPGTLLNERVVSKQFLGSVGNIQVHNITTNHIDTWLANVAGRKAPTTRNRDVQIMKGFFTWASEEQRLLRPERNPIRNIRKLRTTLPDRIFLKEGEWEKLLDAAPNGRNRVALAIGLFLGLRSSEISTLRWEHLDIDNDDPERWRLQVWKPKTAQYDSLPICEELAEELFLWRMDYSDQMGETVRNDWFIVPAYHRMEFQKGFKGKNGERRLNPDRPLGRAERVVKPALAALGYTNLKGEGAHTLRRSMGRALYEELAARGHDRSARIVQSVYGHASLTTTETYLRLDSERLERDQLLAGKRMFTSKSRKVTRIGETTPTQGQ